MKFFFTFIIILALSGMACEAENKPEAKAPVEESTPPVETKAPPVADVAPAQEEAPAADVVPAQEETPAPDASAIPAPEAE